LDIPPGPTAPNQTPLTGRPAELDLPRPHWTAETRSWAADIKADYWAIFDVPEAVEPGLDAVAFVQARIDAFARRWRDSYPPRCAVCSPITTR
jgi:hypothetical protein